MPPTDDDARQREVGRVGRIIIAEAFLLVVGVGVALRLAGLATALVLVGTVTIVVAFAIPLVRPARPSVLTALASRSTSGIWPATAAASVFPELLSRNTSLRGNVEVTGMVSMGPDGVRWDPSPQTVRAFGATSQHWDTTWLPAARRLRGFGGLAQLTLTNPQVAAPVTLWLRRASSLEIP